MRRFILLLILLFIFQVTGFAQIAKIVSLKGDVSVKIKTSSSWKKADPETYLHSYSEIKTALMSECTITLDEDLKNLINIKENSELKISDLKPAKIILPKGKIFFIIDNLANLGEFSVRTPSAITGVRGTGCSIEVISGETTIKCFEGKVYVQGIDSEIQIIETRDLLRGHGLKVGPEGRIIPVLITLSDKDYGAWIDFKYDASELRKSKEKKSKIGISIKAKDKSGSSAGSVSYEGIHKMIDDHKKLNTK